MNNHNQKVRYFIYARKSTDVEDKQVRSIEDQLIELRAFAKTNDLEIVDVLIEKQSAKIPGRPVFNEMLSRIEAGEASGVLSWHPDRLARNSIDGGQLIYLLDSGILAGLKFPTFWMENTSQGKFMLTIAFGQSKYYVDSLAENTKRGLRQKANRGEYPGPAPVGYLNDPRTKTVVVDRRKAKIITAVFEYYAKGVARLEDVSNFLAQRGVLSLGSKSIHKTRATFILSNPFYIGLFRYAGELHEGKHEPIISKKLFDEVQAVLKQRGRPHHHAMNDPQALCGLVRCGTCEMMITAEVKVKRQLNGNLHEYVYYRCTRKSKTITCAAPFIRQESLDVQLSSLLQTVSLSQDWAEELKSMAEKDQKTSAQSSAAFVQEYQAKIRSIQTKLQRLLDGYLEQDIEQEVYRMQKAKLLSEKKSLEENISRIEQTQHDWLEPFYKWLTVAQSLVGIARDHDLDQKKVMAREIFGSNLRLAARRLLGDPMPPYSFIRDAAASAADFSERQLIVGIYDQARTFFQKR